MTQQASTTIFQGIVAASRKGGRGPLYARWINRPLAVPLTYLFWRLGATPNLVSLLGFFITHAGLLLLVVLEATFQTALTVYLLLVFGYIVDSCDGQLARVTGRTSALGEWLDHTADMVKVLTVNMALGYVLITHALAYELSLTPVLLAIFLNLLSQPTHFFVINKTGLGHGDDAAPLNGVPSLPRRVLRTALIGVEYGWFLLIVLLLPLPEIFVTAYLIYGIYYSLFAMAYFLRTAHRLAQADKS